MGTEAQVDALPSLYFDLNGGDDAVGGTTIEVKPSAYMAKNSYKNGQYNYRLLLHASDPAGGVLGANTLRNHRVTFDDENSRIGWEAMDCDKEQKECDGDDKEDEMDKEINEKEQKDGMKMDMGKKAANWTDTVQCIPKGNVGNNGIAPVITPQARTALNNLFESRIATGSGKHGEQPADVTYKLFQVPIPERKLLDNADLTNMTIVDSRQPLVGS